MWCIACNIPESIVNTHQMATNHSPETRQFIVIITLPGLAYSSGCK